MVVSIFATAPTFYNGFILYNNDIASSSPTNTTFGWSCSTYAGTFGVTGPDTVSFTACALALP